MMTRTTSIELFSPIGRCTFKSYNVLPEGRGNISSCCLTVFLSEGTSAVQIDHY